MPDLRYVDMEYTGISPTLMAVGNWWGEYPPNPLQIVGNIDYSNPLRSDPLSGFGKKSSESVNLPSCLSINQNYPNPFNSSTEISFYLPKIGFTSLDVYNLKGQLVKTLVTGVLESGEHSVNWNGKNASENDVSSGIYFYALSTEFDKIIKSMSLVR